MSATMMAAAGASPWPHVSRETMRRLAGPYAPRMAALWLFLNGIGLMFSDPAFFHQPAYRLVAATGLPATFWGVVMLTLCVGLITSHLVSKAIFCAMGMLFSGVFLVFFGVVLVLAGYRFGVVSVNGFWCCYIGIVCLVRVSPYRHPL